MQKPTSAVCQVRNFLDKFLFFSFSRLEASLRDSDQSYDHLIFENTVAIDMEEEAFNQEMKHHRSNLDQMLKDDQFKSESELESLSTEIKKMRHIENTLKHTVLDS